MQQNDRINAIIKVQLALNYLKLCADHENPTGVGVPVDIVAMPDFVVDVDGYAVTQLNNGNLTARLAAAEVGSRAGRILSILAHLRDLDDEGFNLHYIAKTGAVGRAILTKRLNTDLRKKHLQPLRFPFLVFAEDTRYAVLGREECKFVRKPQIVKNYTLLTRNDLTYHFYDPLDVIANAAAVYFGTDSEEQFAELLELVLFGQGVDHGSSESLGAKRERYVFVDLSAVQRTRHMVPETVKKPYEVALERLRKVQLTGKEGDTAEPLTHLIVMIMSDKYPIEQHWRDLKLCEGDTLLVYDNKEMLVVDSRQCAPFTSIPLPYNQRPGGRDAFVAGFLLHRAIAVAWKRIPPLKSMRHVYSGSGDPASNEEVNEWLSDWPQGLFPNPHDATDADDWPLSEAVDFGQALATLWREETDTVPDKRNLLFQNLESPDQKTSGPGTMYLESSILTALDVVQNPSSEQIKSGSFFVCVTLLAKYWLEDRICDGLADCVKRAFLSLLDADLTILPKLWFEKGNERNHTLRIPSLATTRTQFVLDALRRMSMENYWCPDPPTRACLVDLDGTLIQSSGLRRMCLRRAFLAMLDEDPACGTVTDAFPAIPGYLPLREKIDWPVPDVPTFLDRCERLYHYAIYNRWKDWRELLQPYPYYAFGDLSNDFRQVWNHPISYAVFAQVLQHCLENQGCYCEPLGDSPVAMMIRACSEDCYPEIAKILCEKIDKEHHVVSTKELLGPNEGETLQRDVAVWDQKHRKVFQAAVNMYWNVEYQALPHIKQFLRTLRDVLSVSLYVATEGHHDTQLAKIRVVGLDQFFSDLCIMSTGAAATPAEHVRSIDESIAASRAAVVRAESDAKMFKGLMSKWVQQLIAANADQGVSLGTVIDKDPMVRNFRELQEEKRGQRERLQQEHDYLKNPYRHQWEDYGEKKEGAIYSLMIACIMADPERPFLYLTNLQHLVLALQSLPHDYQGLSLAMMGDRETKDIGPLLRALEEAGCSPNAITTVRLLTRDHCDESLYWREEVKAEDKPLARYVAWNPLQSLLLLASWSNWPDGLTYRQLPPIVNARLFGKSGVIDEHNWNAMAWGESRTEETYTLMNYFITESTVRANAGGIAGFADALRKKMVAAGQCLSADEYRFAWVTITRFLANVIAIGECRTEVAEVIRDTICDEIVAARVKANSDYRGKAVDCLMTLSGGGERPPYCLPPSIPSTALINRFPFEEGDQLRRLIEKWRRGILMMAEALRERIVKAGQPSDDNGEEYRSAWMTVTRFIANVIDIGECSSEVAKVIRDTVCDEIGHGRVANNHDYGRMAVDSLDMLSGRGRMAPFCPPPRGGDHGLINNVPFGECDRLKRMLEKWREAAAQHEM